jgi:hypothetical protein
MNVLARLLGVMAFVVGTAFVVAAEIYWRDPSLADRTPSVSGSAFGNSLGVAIFCFVVGALFVLVEPYRPDLKERERSSGELRKSWWTGSPRN